MFSSGSLGIPWKLPKGSRRSEVNSVCKKTLNREMGLVQKECTHRPEFGKKTQERGGDGNKNFQSIKHSLFA